MPSLSNLHFSFKILNEEAQQITFIVVFDWYAQVRQCYVELELNPLNVK